MILSSWPFLCTVTAYARIKADPYVGSVDTLPRKKLEQLVGPALQVPDPLLPVRGLSSAPARLSHRTTSEPAREALCVEISVRPDISGGHSGACVR